VALVIAGLTMTVPLLAQRPRFSAGTAAVRVDVLVTQRNQPITGLTARDFELRDNGVLQQIRDVSDETLPLNVIGVLDLSDSVAGEPLAQLKQATLAVIDALGDKDRAALVTFSERLQLLSPLTGDKTRLRAVVDSVEARGATSVIDAAFAGLALRESDEARTLMLLFSDGRDTTSWLTARAVLEAARRSDVVIYAVTFGVNVAMLTSAQSGMFARARRDAVEREHLGERLLEAFAEETGGRLVYADGERSLRPTFVQVLSEFRQRYVLSYSPTDVSGEGWHTLTVSLRGKSGQVKARRGYFASPVTRAGEAKAPPK
jgi:VWFA-related protein